MTDTFQAVVSALAAGHAISTSRMFGSDALKYEGKVFAMCVKGELVVKLPGGRANVLVEQGTARPFDPGHGRPMKEWVSVPPTAPVDWMALSEEALAYCTKGQARRSPATRD